ncbi:MAG: methylenetetrahydrofolate reductase [Pseudomonadota bacterium]|nr:methylenetetrahydrofolate reductase [Pseudomonadota bacterium]
MQSALASFLARFSLEITPRQADKLPLIAARAPKGTRVYIALVDPADVEAQFAAAIAARAHGFEPVPHIPARFITDAADLERRVAKLAGDAGVRQMLVLGGGASQPLGGFDAAIQLLRTGVFERHGIVRLGVAGHPEGNPDITRKHGEAALLAALREKQAYIASHGLDGYIATQFLFAAEPVATWAAELRAAGIELPIHVGVPGPATIKTLVRYAAVCGVGNSARFLRKQALNVAKLLSVSTPDEFVSDLAGLAMSNPALGIAAPHLYPFGGFDRLFDWLEPKLPERDTALNRAPAPLQRRSW